MPGMQNYAHSVVANKICPPDACWGENNGVAPTRFWWDLYVGNTGELCKTVEPIEMPFRGLIM